MASLRVAEVSTVAPRLFSTFPEVEILVGEEDEDEDPFNLIRMILEVRDFGSLAFNFFYRFFALNLFQISTNFTSKQLAKVLVEISFTGVEA